MASGQPDHPNQSLIDEAELEDRRENALADEIHDGVVQWLVGAKMQAEGLRTQVNAGESLSHEPIDRLIHSLSRGIVESRRLMRGLSQPPIENGRWHEMLRWELDQLLRSLPPGTPNPHLICELSESTEPLANDLAITVYRLAREAVWNSLRHATAATIRVFCNRDAGAIELRVVDDGRGFDPATVRIDARGVSGLQRRATLAGGEAKLETTPGKGTTWKFRFADN